MKLLIYTAVWKRPEITEICFMGIQRLQKVPGFHVESFAVISEPDMIGLCEKYGVHWALAPNHPLGAKKNFGIKQTLKYDYEYLIEIGSDDLLKTEALYSYGWDAPVLGLMDFALINTRNGQAKRISTTIPKFGAGRAIKRFVIENFKIWNDANCRGLDNSSTFELAKNGIMMKGVKTDGPLVVGLKSGVNLWDFDSLAGKRYDINTALNGLSEEEITAIKCLVAKNTSADLIER